MSITLKVVLIVVCVITFAYTMKKIRKSQLQIEDSLFWILTSFGLVIISIFPGLADIAAELLGVGTTVNFIFLFFIFLLLIKVLSLSIKVSQLEDKIKKIIQKNAIDKYEEEKILKELSKH